MFSSTYQADLSYYLAQAAELLGEPVRPVWLDWELERALDKHLVFLSRRGLGREPAVLRFERDRRGHRLAVGMEAYRIRCGEDNLRIARVVLPGHGGLIADFWAVPESAYRPFYRFIRRGLRKQERHRSPVMPEDEKRRLWDNTVGFLRRRHRQLKRYGVAPKRGVLLLGEPGNGKTMACRWLAGQCRRRRLEWRNVSAQEYEDAQIQRRVPALFRLRRPGIILFDDFDTALRDRQLAGENDRQSTFLSELDGVVQKTGVVFLFTSNAQLKDLDPAMRRPGRLDVIIHFPRPTADLRRELVAHRWHPDLLSAVSVETVVDDTEGLSFAEIEEAKKLLVLRHLDTNVWDWPWVREELRARQDAVAAPRPIGFRTPRSNGHLPAGRTEIL